MMSVLFRSTPLKHQ